MNNSFNEEETPFGKLKKNPVFQLSLSSKELFHSNFLSWLAEASNTQNVFRKVLELFGFPENRASEIVGGIQNGRYMVLREYKKFDFCICERIKNYNEEAEDEYIPGRILLVLENKFKSIPYEKQLTEYGRKVEELNEEGRRNMAKVLYKERHENVEKLPRWGEKCYEEELKVIAPFEGTKYVLLSLVNNYFGIDVDENGYVRIDEKASQWHIFTYKEYAEKLSASVSSKPDDLMHQIIKEYASFIITFHELLVKGDGKYKGLPTNENILDMEWSIMNSCDDFANIRMDDVRQKLVTGMICVQLINKLGDANVFINRGINEILGEGKKDTSTPGKGSLFVASGFTRGTALIEIKKKLSDHLVVGIQIQGKMYKRLLETTDNYISNNQDFWKKILPGYYKAGFFRDVIKRGQDWRMTVNKGIFKDNSIAPKPSHNQGKDIQGFAGYGRSFIYQSKVIKDDAFVEDVLDAVISDINIGHRFDEN